MNIDVATLFFANAICAAVACVVLLAGGNIGRPRTGLGYLTVSLALLTIGMILLGQRGTAPLWLSGGVGNVVMATSIVGLRFAVDELMENKSGRARVAIAYGLALLTILLPYWTGSSADARSAAASVAIALLYVMCALPLLTRLEVWMGRTHYLIGGVFITAALLAAARGAGIFAGILTAQLTTPSAFNIGLAVIGLALIVVGSIGFVLMLRERELGRLAMLDGLTEIPNRRGFLDALERALASARRRQFPCCVALVDVDYFKRINDTHGHRAGDDVLRHFAALARGALRKDDALGRYGGDEFVLLLYGSAAAGASIVASRLQAAMAANPARSRDRVIAYTLSIGIGEWRPDRPVEMGELLHQADQALYEAKARGRNGIVRFDELTAAQAVRARAAADTREETTIPL